VVGTKTLSCLACNHTRIGQNYVDLGFMVYAVCQIHNTRVGVKYYFRIC
jgi:hypothetical protein